MSGYVSYPIENDPNELLVEAYNFIKARVPEWEENDANLDTWILQLASIFAADLRTLASDVPDEIFRYLGSSILGIAARDETAATVPSTWVVVNSAGYTIPAGTTVAIRNATGEEFAFRTVDDVIIPAGSTTTAAGAVTLVAVTEGEASSGLGGNGTVVPLIDILDYVTSVTLTAVTQGGLDAETNADYLIRLVQYMRRLSTRPILPEDFSALVLDIPGIARAVAIDGYNPANSTYNNERMVAIAGVDVNGNAISAPLKAEADALLEANREINFVINMIDPTYDTIKVTFAAKAAIGYTPADVEAAAEAAVAAYLSPATWAQDPRYEFTGLNNTWVENLNVRYFNIAQVIENVEGIDYITSLTIGMNAGAMGTTDLVLTGPAGLTTPGAIAGTVT